MSAPVRTRRVLPAAMVGHGVESYDFVIYGASATIIAKHFFPAGDPTLAILSALAVYGLAFVVRPLGAAIFGSIGDRLGRRTALSTVVLIMAVRSQSCPPTTRRASSPRSCCWSAGWARASRWGPNTPAPPPT
mgnify:CR=1 FL=1